MQFLWHEWGLGTAMLLAIVGAAWVSVRAISATERKLIGAAGLALGGLFLVVRSAEIDMTVVALGLWAFGLLTLLRAFGAWRREGSSRLWPVALLLLLPSAVAGALLLGGVLYSILEGPARLARHLTLG
jgi:hypothetical protein